MKIGRYLAVVGCCGLLCTITDCASSGGEAASAVEGMVNVSKPENFYRLSNDVYRSAQPDAEGFRVTEGLGMKSVINLREYHSDGDEISVTELRGFHYPVAAGAITRDKLMEMMIMLHDAPKPVLIHCRHGADRTGALCAAYRIVEQEWPIEKALMEMEHGPFGFHGWYYTRLPEVFRSIDWDRFRQEYRQRTNPAGRHAV